jgi:predicted nuclease with TOPRIM domain
MTDNGDRVTGMNRDNPISADALNLDELSRENRTLRWKLKSLGKQCGKQGQRIFELRNENAALREGREVKMGDYLNLLRSYRAATKEIRRLRGLLDALDEPIAYLPTKVDNSREGILAGVQLIKENDL